MVCTCGNQPSRVRIPNYSQFEGSEEELLNISQEEEIAKKTLCRIRRSSVLLTFYFPLYFMFLVLGSFIFSLIEGPFEDSIREKLFLYLETFKLKFKCISDSDLEGLIEEILEASNRGVSAARNVSGEPNWSFGQSFFFSSTIVTTIGYGHVHPLSEGGKIFCIVYAVIGIPMTFILLTALVERLLAPTTWLLELMNSKLGHLYQPFNIRVFHLTLVAIFAFGGFLATPAFVFARIEPGWNFLDALYYCFISLTTIGLGDYIPGDARDQPMRPLYKVAITAYLLVGLTFVMLLLHLYNDIPQLNVGFFLLRRSDAATDPERMRLSGAAGIPSQKYTQHNDQTVMQNVKVVSRPVDSPSPEEEDTTPVHAQMPPLH